MERLQLLGFWGSRQLLQNKFFDPSTPFMRKGRNGGEKKNGKNFEHISSTEARIFMKFETYAHKIVIYHQPNFHKDPRKDARARGEN